jgi:hypothetical protein
MIVDDDGRRRKLLELGYLIDKSFSDALVCLQPQPYETTM